MEPGMIEQPEQTISPLDEPTPCPGCSALALEDCQCFRLCPYHRDSLHWDACSEGFTGCEVDKAIHGAWAKGPSYPLHSSGPSARNLTIMLWFIAKDLSIDTSDTTNAVTITRRVRQRIAELLASDDQTILCEECHEVVCECEETYGTEAHSDRLEREARDRANAGDWEKGTRDDE